MSALSFIRNDFESFFQAPFEAYGEIYGKASPYVSPLRSDLKRMLTPGKNPLFRSQEDFSFFTAIDRQFGRLQGRILVHSHPAANTRWKTHRAYFGFLDAVDRPEVTRALLTKAEDWARARGFSELWGNFNLTSMQRLGVVFEDRGGLPFAEQMWTPPYLKEAISEAGYKPCMGMRTFHVALTAETLKHFDDPGAKSLERDPQWKFAPVTKSWFRKNSEALRGIFNEGFAANPLFVPISREEFDFQAAGMTHVMDERISHLAFHRGEPVGALICIPDINPFLKKIGSRLTPLSPLRWYAYKKKASRAVLVFASVKPRFQGRRVNHVLTKLTLSGLIRAGYEELGVTWVGDDNRASQKYMRLMGAQLQHRLYLMRKSLGQS